MESDDEHDMEIDTDRISVLPTKILQHIMPFLGVRTVVRMRRLSRRWRKVCGSLQFICLDYK